MIYPEYKERAEQITCPSLLSIRLEVFNGFKDFVGTKAQIDARENELHERAYKLEKEARKAFENAYDEVVSEFAEALHKEYGTGVKVLDDAVYGEADRRGHSGGFSDIESVYIDLIEIAKIGLKEGMKLGPSGQEAFGLK